MPTMPAMSSWPARIASAAIVCATVTGNGLAAIEEPYSAAWTTQIGTTQLDRSSGVAVDSSGFAYISGLTDGDLDGANAGNFDAFLSRVDTSGTVLWTKQFGASSFDSGSAIAVDSVGNSYVVGRTDSDLGGTSLGNADAYLIKFDSSGNQVWSRQVGTSESDRGWGVAVDSLGNAYISGSTKGNFSGFSNQGEQDAYVVKFNAVGTQLWAHQIGTEYDDISEAVAVDSSGNVYISGLTKGGLEGANAGLFDAFLVKFDSSGNQVWTRQFGTTGNEVGESIALDSSGNIYVAGSTRGSISGTNAGSNDPFFVKYDAAGNQVLARQFGSPGDDRTEAVSVDSMGNIFISGYTFDDLEGSNIGVSDVYLTKYNASGSLLWTDQFGTSDADEGQALAVDSLGNVYSSGATRGALSGLNVGETDAFLRKYTVPEPASLSLLAVGGLVLLRRGSRT